MNIGPGLVFYLAGGDPVTIEEAASKRGWWRCRRIGVGFAQYRWRLLASIQAIKELLIKELSA